MSNELFADIAEVLHINSDDCAVGQNQELAELKTALGGGVDKRARRLPGEAAIGRARKNCNRPVAAALEPHGVGKMCVAVSAVIEGWSGLLVPAIIIGADQCKPPSLDLQTVSDNAAEDKIFPAKALA